MVGGGNMVNTQKVNSQLPMAEKMGFSEIFLFLRDYILEKENTHTPSQLLDSSFLDWDYIAEQGKVLNKVQLLDITTGVLLPN